MTVVALADAAVRRCRRYRLFAAVAQANGAPAAADKWRRRASDLLSLAYDLQPHGLPWQPPTGEPRPYDATPCDVEPA